jgi:lipopolysaccharide heptosyltransferase II
MTWMKAKNVLCVRLDAMGDVLMTTPAMEALKEMHPERRLTLLTSVQGKKIAESIPFIDEVLTYPAPWLKTSAESTGPEMFYSMVKTLQDKKFDAVVIFTVYSQNPLPSAMLCFLAGIPLRAAYCRENPYALLTDWMKESEPDQILRHEVKRQLDLVSELGAASHDRRMILAVNSAARSSMLGKLTSLGVEKELERWILIHPGSTAPSRRYPPAGFAQAAEYFCKHSDSCILFLGGAQEYELIEEVRSLMKSESFNLGGTLTLEESIALIEMAPVLISNNSGPVHIAAALGTPVVDLYALTNPQHTPWMVKHALLFKQVPCRFCYKSLCPEGHNDCLNKISPYEIFQCGVQLARQQPEPEFDATAIYPLTLA